MVWKLLSRTTRLYAVFLVVFGGYASYSLGRVVAGFGDLGEKAVLTRFERRISNIRQIILLLLLLFGMTVANEAFTWLRGIRLLQSQCGDCVYPFGAGAKFAFAVLAALVFLHAFQWIASVRLQRCASGLSG
jgi:membrane protein YqaA with SNARE-associated domain